MRFVATIIGLGVAFTGCTKHYHVLHRTEVVRVYPPPIMYRAVVAKVEPQPINMTTPPVYVNVAAPTIKVEPHIVVHPIAVSAASTSVTSSPATQPVVVKESITTTTKLSVTEIEIGFRSTSRPASRPTTNKSPEAKKASPPPEPQELRYRVVRIKR